MVCIHSSAEGLSPPRRNQPVYREDCTLCFDSIDDETGLNVCLTCFNGGCAGDRNHALLHYEATKHAVYVSIKRTRRVRDGNEPPKKITKLAIAAETDEDRYITKTRVGCYECDVSDVEGSSGKIAEIVNGVLQANTFSRSTEIKAWEQDMTACEHTLYVNQSDARNIESQDLGHCSMCDLKENLWLCLHCGNLGCGRDQFGVVRGNSHGLAHFGMSQHPVAVKLGSITSDGSADIYCYSCNEERIDSALAEHLAHWGINITEREKTEKSLTEMQIEHNLRWDFSMTTEDGQDLQPLFGPSLTGLKNLGNSCYLSSVLQCLFELPEFRDRYYQPKDNMTILAAPAEDLETQLRKVADGLNSGRYSNAVYVDVEQSDSGRPHQLGIAPSMLKSLIGFGHPEFSTMHQQDAFELLLHLFKLINRSHHPKPLVDPTSAFRFVLEQRLQCLSCRRVSYRTDTQDNISVSVPVRRTKKTDDQANGDEQEEFEPITLTECLDIFTAAEKVELTCSACQSQDGFSKRSMFRTLPANLALNARRFEIVNWVPTKLDIPLIVEDGLFSMDKYLSVGPTASEELLPEDDAGPGPAAFVPDEAALSQLESMGFSRTRSEHALYATGNEDAEAAMNWLFGHMEDPNIDIPLELTTASSAQPPGTGDCDPDSVAMLSSMGFSEPHAKKGLEATEGNMERAVEWLFSHPDNGSDEPAEQVADEKPPGSAETDTKYQLQSIICHKGRSIHSGHYVAFIRKELLGQDVPSWVLFNDEKVVEAANVDEMKRFAYIYILRRV